MDDLLYSFLAAIGMVCLGAGIAGWISAGDWRIGLLGLAAFAVFASPGLLAEIKDY